MKNHLVFLVYWISFIYTIKSQINPYIYEQRPYGQEMDSNGHRVPSKADSTGWDEIFQDEYRQMLEKQLERQNGGGMKRNGGTGNGNASDVDDDMRDEDDDLFDGVLEVEDDWPAENSNKVEFGEVSGVAVDKAGFVYVLHRANRTWINGDFDVDNSYRWKNEGPISQAVIYKLNSSNGALIEKWGKKMLFMPHGLEVDKDDNIYITDVALHQVLVLKAGNYQHVHLSLGIEFESARDNDDKKRFCMPTDVAVDSVGNIYVTDGYCNSRVVKFDKDGKYLMSFGENDSKVPHGIAIAENVDYICLADREGMRVLCYNGGVKDSNKLGQPEREFSNEVMGRVFGLTYSKTDGVLYAVTGQTGILASQGFTIDLKDDSRYLNEIISNWSPQDKGFDHPHDLAVSEDGNSVYVAEIEPNRVWKFNKR